jgi:hypothetical protein
MVYHGHHHGLAEKRQRVLDAAYASNPQRWINAPPRVPMPPEIVAINPAPRVDYRTHTTAGQRSGSGRTPDHPDQPKGGLCYIDFEK